MNVLSRKSIESLTKVPLTERTSYQRSNQENGRKRITYAQNKKYKSKSKSKSNLKLSKVQKEAKFNIDQVCDEF